MVAEIRSDHESDRAVMTRVAELLGVGAPETVRTWVRRVEVDAGARPGVTSEDSAEVSSSTYEWVAKQPTRRELRDAVLVAVICAMREEKTGKFVQALDALKLRRRGKGLDVGVERSMREQCSEGAQYGSRHKTTIAGPGHDRPPDLVDRNFWAPAPNRLLVADVSCVPTWTGMVYVAFVVDEFSRRIVGWRAATTMPAVSTPR